MNVRVHPASGWICFGGFPSSNTVTQTAPDACHYSSGVCACTDNTYYSKNYEYYSIGTMITLTQVLLKCKQYPYEQIQKENRLMSPLVMIR